jgi:hypothetical protein
VSGVVVIVNDEKREKRGPSGGRLRVRSLLEKGDTDLVYADLRVKPDQRFLTDDDALMMVIPLTSSSLFSQLATS